MLTELVLATAVVAHLNNLDSRDVRRVHAAVGALTDMAPLSIPALHEGSRTLPARAGARCAAILAIVAMTYPDWFVARMLPDYWPNVPWVDMLPTGAEWPDSHTKQSFYLKAARAAGSRCDGPPEWNDYRAATRLLLADLLRCGWSEQRIRNLLNDMRDNERTWIIEHGFRFNPPVLLPGQGRGPEL